MVQSNYTIELDKHLVAAKRRQAIGVLQSDLLPGVPLSMSANEKEAFYGFLGVYEALHEKLGTLLNGNFAPDFKRQFQDLYAANVAAQYAARRCVPVLSGGQPAAGQEGTRYAVTGFGKGVADDRRERLFASPFKEYLSRPRPDESLALGGLFSSYLRASESVASDPRFADARSVAGAFSVVIDGEAYAAFRSAGLEGAIAAQLPPAEERVVGNVEMMSGLRSALYALAHFDGNTNPFKRRVRLPKTVSIQGDPGTGKTIGIRQSIADAQRDFGPQMSVPLKTVALTNAIKSSYFAKSAENVRTLFREVRETKAAYVIVADDIESIIHDRRSVGNNVEEANVTQTLLNELEGLFSVDKGNYLFIATSNHQLRVDPALDDRLSELILFAPGPRTPEEYAQTFQVHFGAGLRDGSVRVDDWGAIGDAAAAAVIAGKRARPLSGRHVKDVVTSINLEYVAASAGASGTLLRDEQLAKQLMTSGVTTLHVLEHLGRFVEAKRRSANAEFEELVEERLLELRVAAEAKRRFVGVS